MRLAFSLCSLLLALLTGPAHATVGLAEWEVYTPGGNLISHTDTWKDEHGTCLRSEAKHGRGNPRIHASHLKRWRYYDGHVAGEDAQGFFLFDEDQRTITRLRSEASLSRAVDSRGLDSISTWLGPGDGWQEAWFPFMVWRPCKILLAEDLEPVTAGLSSEELDGLRQAVSRTHTTSECREALDGSRYVLYRRTTWGRLCRRLAGNEEPSSREQPFLRSFCDELKPYD